MSNYELNSNDVINFFIDNFDLHIIITPEFYGNGINYNVQLIKYDKFLINSDYIDDSMSTGIYGDNGEYDTYNKALNFGLNKAIEIINKNKLK